MVRFKSSMALLAVLLATGCSSGSEDVVVTPVIANCVINELTDNELYTAGVHVARGDDIRIPRLAAAHCSDWTTALTMSTAFKQEMQVPLINAMMEKEIGRKGFYSQIAGPNMNRDVQLLLGDLGAFLDRGNRAALQALSCKSMAPEAIEFIKQLETPMATATIGYHINLGQPEAAMSVATLLLDMVDKATRASAEAYAQVDCATTDGKDRFTAYARELNLFAKGQHPWAPGCGVDSDEKGLILRCKGPGDTTFTAQ